MNIKNLTLLAAYLEKLPAYYEHFNMASYMCDEDDFQIVLSQAAGHPPTHCGTVACAVGHAPFVTGMPQPNFSDYSWAYYSERIFDMGGNDMAWDWCFSAPWDDVDNTPKGAAARIRYLIKHPDLEGWMGHFRKEELESRGIGCDA